jgi:hypothetical protein
MVCVNALQYLMVSLELGIMLSVFGFLDIFLLVWCWFDDLYCIHLNRLIF